MKKIQKLLGVCLLTVLLSGCGDIASSYDRNTLIIKGNGSILEVAVEDLQNLGVSEEDIASYIVQQIKDYKEKSGKSVNEMMIDASDLSKVRLVLEYEDMESYNGFNEADNRLISYQEATDADLKGSYTSASGEQINVTGLKDASKAKVLLVTDATDIVVKGEILAWNEEVTLSEDVATTSGNGTAVILYK